MDGGTSSTGWNKPAKRTLQDDLSMLQSLGLVELSGRGAGARWSLPRDPK